MNRLFIAFGLLLILFACRGRETVTSTDTISTSGTETTGTESKTSTGFSGGTVSSLNAEDKQFFVAAAAANLSEVSLGQLAMDRATNADVKTFASRMIADHGNANGELTQLALRKGVALPTTIPTSDLSNIAGADFDRAYINQMVRDHQKAVGDFQSASVNAKDPDLRAWAAKTLPTLQDHLAAAKRLQSKLR